ncbi:MAG: RlmE family RNA methyltransferase [Deltaproteobacteria bacterium]|jgi:23S rRNA (uridine2552-2'-O)-methyltransferase|nr:RlmE family RNA methyltransferase [Deltaproteobacteria bacterium]
MTVKDRDRLDDHWSRKARSEGYPARSVYKLEEIDLKHRLLKKGMRILDLGASPGSWSLYAADKVAPRGKVLGVDLKPLSGASRPNLSFLARDVLTLAPEELASEGPFDGVVSDLAPPTTGRRDADAARSLELAAGALRLASALLRAGGFFVAKLFEGADAQAFVKGKVQPLFARAVVMRPKAVRKGSVEIFAVGLERLAGGPGPGSEAA